jgi:hypothetical protein
MFNQLIKIKKYFKYFNFKNIKKIYVKFKKNMRLGWLNYGVF